MLFCFFVLADTLPFLLFQTLHFTKYSSKRSITVAFYCLLGTLNHPKSFSVLFPSIFPISCTVLPFTFIRPINQDQPCVTYITTSKCMCIYVVCMEEFKCIEEAIRHDLVGGKEVKIQKCIWKIDRKFCYLNFLHIMYMK